MTPTQTLSPKLQESPQPALDLLVQESLSAICNAPGPCVTVFLPACHPGAADLGRAERLKTILRDATHQLEQRRFREPVTELLKPLEQLAKNPASHVGGGDSVIFASPGNFRHFRLPGATAERLVVAAHPHITPFLAQLMPQPVFYVLAIAKKHLRLGKWERGQCTEVSLPAGVPDNFDETVTFDQPDHDLQSHAQSGRSSAHVGSVRFGTGAERDLVHKRLRQYFQVVSRELTGFLGDAPLVVIGVAEEVAAFLTVSPNPRVIVGKPTSPEHFSWIELGKRAQQAMLDALQVKAAKAFDELRETIHRNHVTTDVREVLHAAREGRVHKLLVQKNAEYQGLLGPSFPVDSSRLEGDQDLINAAAVETIRGRGEVCVLDRELSGSPLAALLRY